MHVPTEFKTGFSVKSTVKNKPVPWRKCFSPRKILQAVYDYCLQSSLHGFKYVGDCSLPFTDRMYWLVIVSISLYLSTVTIWLYYQSGALEKFEMSFNPTSTPIWDIPFPTILVCPVNPIRKSVFDLSNPRNNTKFMHYSKMVCQYQEKFSETYTDPVGEDMFQFLNEAAIPCKNMMKKCLWNGREVDCCSIFKPTITPIGQCYEFNNIHGHFIYKTYNPAHGNNDVYEEWLEYWNITNASYPNRNGNKWKTVFPYWSESVGEMSGLTVDLVENKSENQIMCTGPLGGFEIKVCSPAECTELVTGIRLLKGIHTHIMVAPTLIISEEGLRSVPQDERGCMFQNEYPLNYFKIYTQTNCYVECYLSLLQERCDCSPFFFHRFIGHVGYRYCNDAMVPCQIEVLNEINEFALRSKKLKNSCVCDPSCTGLSFSHQTSLQPIVSLDSKPPWAEGHVPASQLNSSRFSVYFKIQQFTSLTRKKTASVSDFLGTCGGLLGLFIGYSVMSAYEVFYFAIVRPLDKLIIYFTKFTKK